MNACSVYVFVCLACVCVCFMHECTRYMTCEDGAPLDEQQAVGRDVSGFFHTAESRTISLLITNKTIFPIPKKEVF